MNRLGIHRDNASSVADRITICLISPRDAYSETFIRAHIERLPAKVRVLSGGWFPLYRDDGRPLLPTALPRRLMPDRWRQALIRPAGYLRRMALRRFLRTNQVKAVLAEFGLAGLAVMESCQRAGVPLIVHFHGFDAYDRTLLEHEGRRYPELFAQAAAIIAVSRDMERQLLRLGAPADKLYYNPYGVDLVLFSGGRPEEAPPVFVAVGRFVDKKAPHLTLLAFANVVQRVPTARLRMIGDGVLWEACRQLARALGVENSVDFLGPRPQTEVAAMLRQARGFVQHSMRTSYGDSEGTPVAVLEAGAAGLPVVATRHGGIPDVVVDGHTGFLVDEGDVEGMAERMVRLAKDPALAAQLGQAARARISAEFSMDKSIANLWAIIQRSIEQHARR